MSKPKSPNKTDNKETEEVEASKNSKTVVGRLASPAILTRPKTTREDF